MNDNKDFETGLIWGILATCTVIYATHALLNSSEFGELIRITAPGLITITLVRIVLYATAKRSQ